MSDEPICIRCGKSGSLTHQGHAFCPDHFPFVALGFDMVPTGGTPGIEYFVQKPVVQSGQLKLIKTWRGQSIDISGGGDSMLMSKIDDPANFDYSGGDAAVVVGSGDRVRLIASVNGKIHTCLPGGEWAPPLPDSDDPQPDHIIKAE